MKNCQKVVVNKDKFHIIKVTTLKSQKMKNKPVHVEKFMALFPWSEVLKLSMKKVKTAIKESDLSTEPFEAKDIKEIIDYHEGIPDLEDWIMIGITQDERYFYLKSGCGYDGFDKFSWGQAVISHSMNTLYKEAVMEDERLRFDPNKIYAHILFDKPKTSMMPIENDSNNHNNGTDGKVVSLTHKRKVA